VGTILGLAALAACCLVAGCERRDENKVQGYIEGEFVYASSSVAGTLDALRVQRGDSVKAGDALFDLENTPQLAVRDEAAQRLAQARASLEDLTKGKRPSEIEAIAAQLQQARAALELAEKEFSRQEGLAQSNATTTQELDRARSARDQGRQKASQLEAELKTAELGARSDQIVAAQANVRALEAALAKAEWELSQTHQTAPQTGFVFDTLFRPGEWVAAGKPVVMLLPPANVKVRAFVSETRVGAIHAGDEVRVTIDGVSGPIVGHVSFISPKAEYTPPVIYSRSNRSKLVFMVEAVFDPNTAATLHPGQPVDVEFGS
jgi:HlyD family secretion protein